jgi:hypothetical protein
MVPFMNLLDSSCNQPMHSLMLKQPIIPVHWSSATSYPSSPLYLPSYVIIVTIPKIQQIWNKNNDQLTPDLKPLRRPDQRKAVVLSVTTDTPTSRGSLQSQLEAGHHSLPCLNQHRFLGQQRQSLAKISFIV